jgi:sulfite reductase (NADPH) hemoprotein beta-component
MRAPLHGNVYVGGNEAGTRLNKVYLESVKDADMDETLGKILKRFQQEREGDERFGDWSARVLWPELESAGKE